MDKKHFMRLYYEENNPHIKNWDDGQHNNKKTIHLWADSILKHYSQCEIDDGKDFCWVAFSWACIIKG